MVFLLGIDLHQIKAIWVISSEALLPSEFKGILTSFVYLFIYILSFGTLIITNIFSLNFKPIDWKLVLFLKL